LGRCMWTRQVRKNITSVFNEIAFN
jgi:hypothetical protein